MSEPATAIPGTRLYTNAFTGATVRAGRLSRHTFTALAEWSGARVLQGLESATPMLAIPTPAPYRQVPVAYLGDWVAYCEALGARFYEGWSFQMLYRHCA